MANNSLERTQTRRDNLVEQLGCAAQLESVSLLILP